MRIRKINWINLVVLIFLLILTTIVCDQYEMYGNGRTTAFIIVGFISGFIIPVIEFE